MQFFQICVWKLGIGVQDLQHVQKKMEMRMLFKCDESSPACYCKVKGSIKAFLSPQLAQIPNTPGLSCWDLNHFLYCSAHFLSSPLNHQHSNIVSTEPDSCVLLCCASIVAGKVWGVFFGCFSWTCLECISSVPRKGHCHEDKDSVQKW